MSSSGPSTEAFMEQGCDVRSNSVERHCADISVDDSDEMLGQFNSGIVCVPKSTRLTLLKFQQALHLALPFHHFLATTALFYCS